MTTRSTTTRAGSTPTRRSAFLTTEAYWGRWRGAEDIKGQIATAWRVVGAYDRSGAMVGFARAFGDGGAAYLADVYVLPGHRGRRARQGRRADDDRGRPGRRVALDAAHLRRARAVPAVRLRPARTAATWSAPPAAEAVPSERLTPAAWTGKPARRARWSAWSRWATSTCPGWWPPRPDGGRAVPLVPGAAGRGPGPSVRRDGDRGPGQRDGRAVRRGPRRGRHGDRLDAVLGPRLLAVARRRPAR